MSGIFVYRAARGYITVPGVRFKPEPTTLASFANRRKVLPYTLATNPQHFITRV